MRFLHTADWHLGRSFHGASLLDAQVAWAAWLADVAREAKVDGILVSGDLYDRALPPVDAVTLADETLRALVEIAPVVLISGNHDSATRLGFGSALLEQAGLHLRTDVTRIGDPVLLGDTAVYGIPYLEPDVARPLLDVEARGHGPVLQAAMERVGADLARRPGMRSVVLAHAFVAGAAASESERDLSVGGAASVPTSVFGGVDYVALGHLHAPQRVGANGRYAGSPVAFSFSEAGHAKSVALVDLQADGTTTHELVACPVRRPLAILRGPLEELLWDGGLVEHEASWVQVTLTDPVRPVDAMERVRKRFPHAVVLAFEPEGAAAAAADSYAVRLKGLDDRQLAAAFVQDVRGEGPSADEQALLDDALAAHRVAEVVR